MPAGDFYIKTESFGSKLFMPTLDEGLGLVSSPSNTFYGYADAFVRYGLSLSDGAIDKLMTFNPNKSPKGVSLATQNGVSYDAATVGKVDERVFSVDVHIVAQTKEDYLNKYERLRDEVLVPGKVIVLRTNHRSAVRYRVIYQRCEPFRQWMLGGMAMFTLAFIEPHPELQETPDLEIAKNVIAIVDNESGLSGILRPSDGDSAYVKNTSEGHIFTYHVEERISTWLRSSSQLSDGDNVRNVRRNEIYQYTAGTLGGLTKKYDYWWDGEPAGGNTITSNQNEL